MSLTAILLYKEVTSVPKRAFNVNSVPLITSSINKRVSSRIRLPITLIPLCEYLNRVAISSELLNYKLLCLTTAVYPTAMQIVLFHNSIRESLGSTNPFISNSKRSSFVVSYSLSICSQL